MLESNKKIFNFNSFNSGIFGPAETNVFIKILDGGVSITEIVLLIIIKNTAPTDNLK